MSHFISHGGFHWEYETFGSGKKIMLAFHGFGNSSSDFRVFEATLGKVYTIHSFSLPYHGKSHIDASAEAKVCSKDELRDLFLLFFRQHHITTFSLMGYSLGGKIALQLLEFFPERVISIFLFAPDGIRNNWSSGFVTRNTLGKKIYGRIIDDPSRFFHLVKLLKKMNLLHEKLSEFLHQSLNTREKRQQVWDVWLCFRDIRPDIRKIQHTINEKDITVHLYFGKYDRIIPPSIGENFMKGLKNRNGLHVVEMGHVMIRDKMNQYLSDISD